MSKDFDKYNDEARGWARQTRRDLRNAVLQAGAVHTGELSRSVRYGARRSFGVIHSLSFKFPRHGIFVEKGVGKGWPITGRTAMNSVKARIAKPWFNPVIDANIGKLADKLAGHSADIATENIKIR